MIITSIKTEEDYQQALEQLSSLFDSKIGTSESDEADLLALLVDEYENNHYPIHWKTSKLTVRVDFQIKCTW